MNLILVLYVSSLFPGDWVSRFRTGSLFFPNHQTVVVVGSSGVEVQDRDFLFLGGLLGTVW